MKAAVIHSFDKPLTIEDVPKPKADSGEVVVKVETCGLCHSDIHAAHGDWPFKPKLPLIPGHEVIGIVESLGTGVKEVKEGDRVAIPWMGYACGSCHYCVSGWETRREQQVMTGYLVDGGYAEYAKANAKFIGKVHMEWTLWWQLLWRVLVLQHTKLLRSLVPGHLIWWRFLALVASAIWPYNMPLLQERL